MNSQKGNIVMRKVQVGTQSQLTRKSVKTTGQKGKSFSQVLNQVQAQKSLTFSKHATQRLAHRNIVLKEADIAKLSQAVDKASKKGVKEALILMDQKAFIAHVKNRTIITAAMEDQLKESVFTNIDGAVIV